MTEEWLKNFNEVKVEDFMINPFDLYHCKWCIVTSGDEKKCNSLTISWGGLGTYMSYPITNIYINQRRYTKEFLDKNEYFTVCELPQEYRDKLDYIGKHSGRDEDKYAATGLKPIKLENSMAIEQAKVIYLCKKIVHVPIPLNHIEEDCKNKTKYFNKDIPNDYSEMYMGEIKKILVRK